jgi:hypothetical protein
VDLGISYRTVAWFLTIAHVHHSEDCWEREEEFDNSLTNMAQGYLFWKIVVDFLCKYSKDEEIKVPGLSIILPERTNDILQSECDEALNEGRMQLAKITQLITAQQKDAVDTSLFAKITGAWSNEPPTQRRRGVETARVTHAA